jgi:nucleotide-binding universal stress UspA family protein
MKLLHLNVVLAAIDSAPGSAAVLRGARELAMAAGAKLHVLHVARSDAAVHRHKQAEPTDDVKRLLDDAGMTAGDADVHTLGGEPALGILSLAERIHADVIVLGRHRPSAASDQALGSTALRVVTSSDAPCLVLANAIALPLERVLVPVDLSDTSRGALALALSWASALRGAEKSAGPTLNEQATLTALLVDAMPSSGAGNAPESGLDDELRRLGREAGNWAGVAIESAVVRSDNVTAAIAEYAVEHHSDLVVLGTRGVGADSTRRLGSVSAGVSRQLSVPILLVPPAVWSANQLNQ